MSGTTVNQKITPMIWFDNNAEEAVKLYTSAFRESATQRVARYGKEGFEVHGQKEGTVMTIDFTLDGFRLAALNGGPHFKINPSISFFVTLESESELNALWQKLSEGGIVLMPKDKYDWSPMYGWLQDRFGVSWQISLGKKSDFGGHSIVPAMMFTKEHFGQAREALNYYVSVFRNSSVVNVIDNGVDSPSVKEKTVMFAQFVLNGQTFTAMDSGIGHLFTFNEAISFVVNCENQEEIDYYWSKLSDGGDPKAQMCGWLKDRFGVSWQVVPSALIDMLHDKDPLKTARVTKAYLKMKKFDIEELKNAYEGK